MTGSQASDDGIDLQSSLSKYAAGLGMSVVLKLASFRVSGSDRLWSQGIPLLLTALAIGQMGIHLVFFVHVSGRPEGTKTFFRWESRCLWWRRWCSVR
ncbi:heme/copper-type cytochrome/quinol oxidase subunit 4 [Variovorax sp. GrIS 2.14]|uniref:hypothetical protein n=1 Tax=Variovorax sp. GrIS 2.14 TaxID=3071709 RepID=UPI0038F6ADFA